ncbi:unnamed protein product [Polarella glacialis]|uniref:Uncharacterized protein n=1 Tax=Polarella glacialis TaxID=89957 RepID=A0A813E8P7_POLGL|nr:unnamed protein product [Polarella glacialis]
MTVAQLTEFYQAHIAELEAYCQLHLLDEGDCSHVCLRSPCPHDHGAAKFRPLHEVEEDLDDTKTETEHSRQRNLMRALPLDMHVVVAVCIKPLTSGWEGVLGYALQRNGATPQKVQTFVSHSWGQNFHDFVRTLQTLRPETVLWICSFALPQNIDISNVLGICPGSSPFATALQRAERVVLAVDEAVEPLGRTWCCYEMYLTITSSKRLDIRAPRTSISLYCNIQERLSSMDIRCSASCTEDHERIMKVIQGSEDIVNQKIREQIQDLCQFLQSFEQSPTGSSMKRRR